VALPYPAVTFACIEHARKHGVFVHRPLTQLCEQCELRRRAHERPHLLKVLQRRRKHARARAIRLLRAGVCGSRMKRGDALRQRVDVLRRERATARHAVEQRILRKALHLQRVFDRWTVAAQYGCRLAAADREYFQIERGRGAPVEAQLFLAIEAARSQGAEIEEAEIYRLFNLVGVVSG